MPIVFVYPNMRDYSRQVEEYIHDYERRAGRTVQVVNPETAEGASFCRAYDVVEYPTILALSEGGSVLKQWNGTVLPVMDEVSYYDNEN